MNTWKEAYETRSDLSQYDDNGLALFALALRFGLEDLDSVASDAITDGNNDKKCDMVYINAEEQYAVLAQCYKSTKQKNEAPANKASDLNTGLGWLLKRQIDEVPSRIKSAAEEIRNEIKVGNIKTLYIWYVHNLPESKNVNDEMITVQETAKSILDTEFSNNKCTVNSYEVGTKTLTEWYEESLTPILVTEEFEIECNGGYKTEGGNWNSYSTSIPAQFLYRIYKKYKIKIFSANVRDYLGSRSTDSNINNGIRKTVENDPGNFWVFNNGLTILTHKIISTEGNKVKVKGFSIVNGAQTTGAIGSLSKLPDKKANVQARFVAVTDGDNDVIHKIIQFNNSQNKVEASDFRSTDKYQKRLKTEFEIIPDAEYEGGRRGGTASAIKRRHKLLASYSVGQALASFHMDPVVAYNSKSAIWINDKLYSKYFNENTKAAHIVCAYALVKSVESKKKQIIDKSKKGSLTKAEEEQLEYFRQRGSVFLLCSAVAGCLETVLGRRIPNLFRISFGNNISPKVAEEFWTEIIGITIPFCNQLSRALNGGLKSIKIVDETISAFRSLVEATSSSNKKIYTDFSNKIVAP